MQDCEKGLAEKLKPGELVLCDLLRAEARKEGFTRKQLKDARKALDVRTFHQFDEIGATPNWFWYRD